VICLAEGDPAGALDTVQDVLDGTAPVIGYVTAVEAHLVAGPPTVNSVTSARPARGTGRICLSEPDALNATNHHPAAAPASRACRRPMITCGFCGRYIEMMGKGRRSRKPIRR
jgi:hypothetical protein